MVKNDKSTKMVIGVLVVILAYILLTSGKSSFDITQLDTDNEVIHTQAFSIPTMTSLTQAMFSGTPFANMPFFMQSTMPVTEKATLIMRAIVTNPFPGRAKLLGVRIYKNEEVIDGRNFIQLSLQKNEEYVYKSEEIDLSGNKGQYNILRLEFVLENQEGVKQAINYEYKYLDVTPCRTNSHCSAPNSICDRGNLAGFSTHANEFYCARPCVSNDGCFPGQICRKGVCAYVINS